MNNTSHNNYTYRKHDCKTVIVSNTTTADNASAVCGTQSVKNYAKRTIKRRTETVQVLNSKTNYYYY